MCPVVYGGRTKDDHPIVYFLCWIPYKCWRKVVQHSIFITMHMGRRGSWFLTEVSLEFLESFIYSLSFSHTNLHSFNKYLLRVYYVPDTVLGVGTHLWETENVSALMEFISWWELFWLCSKAKLCSCSSKFRLDREKGDLAWAEE